MVMEYVPWSTGEGWVADAGSNGLPAHLVLDVGVRHCEALAYAHEKRVLHLDIKPGNIFVEPGGEGAKLADFGLARVLAARGTSALQLRLAGTPAYMAPEQRIEGGKVSPMTDVYQLAATLWDFVAGEPPRHDVAMAPPALPARREVLQVLRTALSLDARARPSAQQFGGMLRVALHGA
jgi:serine/threonine-protein kinase